jgi:hypothetical protein
MLTKRRKTRLKPSLFVCSFARGKGAGKDFTGGYMAKRRLKSIDDVRKYLADLIHRLEEANEGNMDAALAGRLAYISNILLGAIKDSDIERRIQALEERNKG